VTTRHSVALVGLYAAAVWFVAATVFIPVRVTFGAGSVRCGTVLHPDRVSEVANVCPTVTHYRLGDAWPTSVIFGGVASLLFIGGRRAMREQGVVAAALACVKVLVSLMAGAALVMWITGAHSAPGS
jgi:hypothetical protein